MIFDDVFTELLYMYIYIYIKNPPSHSVVLCLLATGKVSFS